MTPIEVPKIGGTSTNEKNYDTLREVKKLIDDALMGLYNDFNAFDVLSDGSDIDVRDKMMRQIAGNQIAYDILAPMKEAIDGAVTKIDNFYKEK